MACRLKQVFDDLSLCNFKFTLEESRQLIWEGLFTSSYLTQCADPTSLEGGKVQLTIRPLPVANVIKNWRMDGWGACQSSGGPCSYLAPVLRAVANPAFCLPPKNRGSFSTVKTAVNVKESSTPRPQHFLRLSYLVENCLGWLLLHFFLPLEVFIFNSKNRDFRDCLVRSHEDERDPSHRPYRNRDSIFPNSQRRSHGSSPT